jgi:hypothetical protein
MVPEPAHRTSGPALLGLFRWEFGEAGDKSFRLDERLRNESSSAKKPRAARRIDTEAFIASAAGLLHG